jgi:diacylglycerol kinase (ATP)
MNHKVTAIEKEKIVFIVNPVSGTGKDENIDGVITSVTDTKYHVIIEKTEYRGHAKKLAKKYSRQGIKKIVAVGGDGTVNEVASALVNTETALGIIPSGSGNGLARYLGIPVSLHAALEIINDPLLKEIDAGKMNKKYFFCTCGTGFDARVGAIFDKKGQRGFFNYIKTAIREFSTYRPKKYTLKIDGKKYKERAFLITFANAGQYGNNAYISPGARIDDGLLDICIMRPFPKYEAFWLGVRLFSRTIDKSEFIEVVKGKKVLIKRKKKIPVHLDGEPVKAKKEICVEIFPAALQVMVPKTTRKGILQKKMKN